MKEAAGYEVTLEEKVVALLKEKGFTLTTAESCTAGLVAGRIMNVPGASDVYNEGYITYANSAKMKLLGVKEETLKEYGAVSYQTAREMAAGAARAAGAQTALAVTGIAGPGGGSRNKPVGLIYIGCYVDGRVIVKECRFCGGRNENRKAAVEKALVLLMEELMIDCGSETSESEGE